MFKELEKCDAMPSKEKGGERESNAGNATKVM